MITFSSSTLINQYSIYEPTLKQYLDERRNEGLLDELLVALEASRACVLFIGDAIIDEYQYVVQWTICQKI